MTLDGAMYLSNLPKKCQITLLSRKLLGGRLSAPESDLELVLEIWQMHRTIWKKLPLVASKKSERLFWIFLAFSEYLNFKKYQIWKMHNENVLRRCPQRIHKEFDLILRPLKLCCQEVNALYSPLVAISVIGFRVLIMFLIPAYWNRGYTTYFVEFLCRTICCPS